MDNRSSHKLIVFDGSLKYLCPINLQTVLALKDNKSKKISNPYELHIFVGIQPYLLT